MSKKEELLRAKLSIIKMIHQFMYTTKINGEVYYDNYSESAGESAFKILGIKSNVIKIVDLCKMRESIERKIWEISLPNKEYNGFKVEYGKDIYY